MISKWAHLKTTAISMRKAGVSIGTIERKLGIPRSTLSGWFKDIALTESQRTRLMENSRDGWQKARLASAQWHRNQKQLRLEIAESAAATTLSNIVLDDYILELAFAMLYWGEGSKNGTTSLGCSDPRMLRFTIIALNRLFGVRREAFRCDLHLRMDQNAEELKQFWSEELGIPISNFKYVAHDKRTSGRATYPDYKGVCLLSVGRIEIQRRLVYLYNLFCDKVEKLDMGA